MIALLVFGLAVFAAYRFRIRPEQTLAEQKASWGRLAVLDSVESRAITAFVVVVIAAFIASIALIAVDSQLSAHEVAAQFCGPDIGCRRDNLAAAAQFRAWCGYLEGLLIVLAVL